MTDLPNSFRTGPDERGHFGAFGGRSVAETLMPLILDLEREYRAAQADPAFKAEFDHLPEHSVGRPSPLWPAERLPAGLRARHTEGTGAQIYLERQATNTPGAPNKSRR